MTPSQIHQIYDSNKLSYSNGHADLKREALTPLFDHLYDCKVIYHERFTFLATISDIQITDQRFSAFILPIAMVPSDRRQDIPEKQKKGWKISCQWQYIRLINSSVCSSPYSCWRIWCDPNTVIQAEEYFNNSDFDKVLQITLKENG